MELSKAIIFGTYGLRMIGYEGGQHFNNENEPYQTLFRDANVDARMGTATTEWLAHWASEAGNEPMCYFSDIGAQTNFGSWGALVHVEDTTSPKYDALMAFLALDTAPTAGRVRLRLR